MRKMLIYLFLSRKLFSMKNKNIQYNPKLKELARRLRKESTKSEILLWKHLSRRQMLGYQFYRQRPIKNYIVDFLCRKLNLIIEIDGDSHNDKQESDIKRQKELEGMGYYFLRFDGYYVLNNITGALQVICDWIEERQGN